MGATCIGIGGAGVTGTGELAREIKAEAAAVSDLFGAFCWASKSPTICCSIAVEASGGGFEGIEARAVGAGVGSESDGARAVNGSSRKFLGKVNSGNILVSKIAKMIKTQSPNHLIRGKEDS